ncbi:LYR motif-containing protein 4 [Coemansia erecta]|uniref:LYR motif-containing protein 4 n=1 Tax=Coemansia asiatica TaxID=1052880 RepID=A0A9W8CIN4_9FUNG|nr:LYR motif-containing protein 4 [Coemansia asiatica]KAJ2845984.1 LYR motif-containing protein 4 [Coemansia erecta]
MAGSRTQIIKLYRDSLRAARGFETYNFRKYFYRRTRDRFRETLSKVSVGQVEAENAMAEGRHELEVLQRQSLVNRLFAHNRTVLESDPQYASGARRPNL